MGGFTVAIVGRPNVGKSTLFNRLLEQKKAIVDDFSGVTRDRQYGVSDWNGKLFNVIDTGGFVSKSDDIFEKEIKEQVIIAINEADLLLFVTDVTAGITDMDDDLAQVLRRANKPVILAVNKVDNGNRQLEATEFYVLGFENTFFISSTSGSGTGDLLDEISKHITEDNQAAPVEMEWVEVEDENGEMIKVQREKDALSKIAIIGQPNAGKSTLLNALTGAERSIVSDIPGTTRDTIHTHYSKFGKEFILIDTAGIRKKKNVQEDLEFYSVIRAIKAMDEADTCMMIVDAEKGMTAQDINIYSLAARKGKGLVVLINKWDVVEEKSTNSARDYERLIKQKIAPFTDVPVMFISAKEKKRIFQAMEKALEVSENRKRRIPTSELNEVMLKEVERFAPPLARGQNVRIKFVMQLPTFTPSFAFYSNHPNDIKKPYQNFLENKIREHFNFNGVPIRLFFRKK
ncbi:MAG TPA: ribosome biogenesis GTPase Der [Edaphocola sp.]|nr:ribosome biogenesis GTPase Der [Edaphocola sp.]